MSRIIQQIAFGDGPDGPSVHIGYYDTDNMRVGGKVVQHVGLEISLAHPDYAQDAEEIMHFARRLLNNALDDWSESEPYEKPAPRDENDDEGMGMGYGDKS